MANKDPRHTWRPSLNDVSAEPLLRRIDAGKQECIRDGTNSLESFRGSEEGRGTSIDGPLTLDRSKVNRQVEHKQSSLPGQQSRLKSPNTPAPALGRERWESPEPHHRRQNYGSGKSKDSPGKAIQAECQPRISPATIWSCSPWKLLEVLHGEQGR